MSKDSDPVTVTLTRDEWQVVKRALKSAVGTEPWPALHGCQRAIERALEPVPAPDPATFRVVAPDPRRKGPWPELKSSQDGLRETER